MRIHPRATRTILAAATFVFAAAAVAQQTSHSVTCADGTADNSAAKAPCHGHGGIKPAPGAVVVNTPPPKGAVAVNTPAGTPKPKPPAPKPTAAPAGAAIIAPTDTKIAPTSTKIESSPTQMAPVKTSPTQKTTTVAVPAVQKGGIGETQEMKNMPTARCSDGTYVTKETSTKETTTAQCQDHGGVAKTLTTGTPP